MSGNEKSAVQRGRYPNVAPATEYVEMPEGSSSAAPVIRPGPRFEKKRWNADSFGRADGPAADGLVVDEARPVPTRDTEIRVDPTCRESDAPDAPLSRRRS